MGCTYSEHLLDSAIALMFVKPSANSFLWRRSLFYGKGELASLDFLSASPFVARRTDMGAQRLAAAERARHFGFDLVPC